MKLQKLSIGKASVMPLMLVATLLASCSSGDSYDNASSPQPAAGAPMTVSADTSGAMRTANSTAATDNTATTDRYDAAGKMDPNGNYNADGTLRTGVVLTPVQERSDAMTSMNGIRATLMTQLDQVRAELKQGGMDKANTDSDKAQAADLAQGLERIDRLLAAMGGATDVTWNQMRTAQLKEASDVRVWWNAHLDKQNEMAKK